MGRDEVTFEVVEHLGVISSSDSGWTKEVNLVSWNGAAPKTDIRDWSPDHDRMTKGITLTAEQTYRLYQVLKQIYSLVEEE